MIEYKEESKSFSVHQSAEKSIYNVINVPHCEYLVIYTRWSHQMIQRIWRNLFGRLWSSDSIKIRAWAQEHIQKSPSYYIHIPLQTYDLFVYVWFQIFKTSQNTSKESSLVSVCFQRNCFRFTNDHQEIIISQILFSKWAKNCSNAWQTKVTAIISAMGWTYIRKKPYHCIVYFLPLFTVETWEFHHIWALTRRSSYIHETSVGIKYLGSKKRWMKIKRPALRFKVSLTGLLTSGCDLHIWSFWGRFLETAVKSEDNDGGWFIYMNNLSFNKWIIATEV